jgi:hypothetical protein
MFHDLLVGLTPAEAGLLFGIVSTLIAAVGLVLRKAWPVVRKIVAVVNSIQGEAEGDVPPGAERRLGVLDRLALNEGKLASIIETVERTALSAEGAQAAAEIAARQASDSAALTRQISGIAAQAAESAGNAAADAAAAREVAENVAAQLQTNGGSTLRDAIDRVEAQLTEHLDSVRHEAPPES